LDDALMGTGKWVWQVKSWPVSRPQNCYDWTQRASVDGGVKTWLSSVTKIISAQAMPSHTFLTLLI
jgi:hypothetical protein